MLMIFILGVFTPIDLAERLSFAVNFPDPFNGQVGGVNRGKLSDTDTIVTFDNGRINHSEESHTFGSDRSPRWADLGSASVCPLYASF